MIKLNRLLKDNRLCKAVLGLSPESVFALESSFRNAYVEQEKARQNELQRKPGAGQKGFLLGIQDKLLGLTQKS